MRVPRPYGPWYRIVGWRIERRRLAGMTPEDRHWYRGEQALMCSLRAHRDYRRRARGR